MNLGGEIEMIRIRRRGIVECMYCRKKRIDYLLPELNVQRRLCVICRRKIRKKYCERLERLELFRRFKLNILTIL